MTLSDHFSINWMGHFAIGLAFSLLLSGSAIAQPVTSIPSCYAALSVASPNTKPMTELFVLVDQTVVFDPTITASIDHSVVQFVRPGNAFEVFQFSAFNQDRYMNLVAKGFVEDRLDQERRDATGSDTLRKLDGCLVKQLNYGGRLAVAAVGKAIVGASGELARSDIIGSLQAISRAVKSSSATRKVLIVASDMLENSALASFYSRGGVRRIVPGTELSKVEASNMLGDFGGADVYVIGAGILPPATLSAKSESHGTNLAYRDPLTMGALKQFWSLYLEKSNARLIEFGEPELLEAPH